MIKEKTLIEKVKAKRKSPPKSPFKINTEISTGVPKDGAPPFPWTPELENEIADLKEKVEGLSINLSEAESKLLEREKIELI